MQICSPLLLGNDPQRRNAEITCVPGDDGARDWVWTTGSVLKAIARKIKEM